jgi:hypothetical protein
VWAGDRVELRLSREAMLGLGTELIRAAHRQSAEPGFWHLSPAEPSFSSQMLGLYLTPDSCELLVAEDDLGSLDEALSSSS